MIKDMSENNSNDFHLYAFDQTISQYCINEISQYLCEVGKPSTDMNMSEINSSWMVLDRWWLR